MITEIEEKLNQEVADALNLPVEQIAELRAVGGMSHQTMLSLAQEDVIKLVRKSAYADRPRLRIQHQQLFHRGDSGEIAPDGVSQAFQHLQEMQQQKEGVQRVARMPTGTAIGAPTMALATTAGLHPDNAGWTVLGPSNIGGRTRSLAIDPTNTQIIWAGSVGGGVWKSTDGGTSWIAVDDLMANIAVCCLTMSPVSNTTLLAGTGEGFDNVDAIRGAGIFGTTDGFSWSQIPGTNTTDFKYVNRIAFSSDGKVILAATNTGIWRCANSASPQWSMMSFGSYGIVQFNPSDNTKAIAGGINGKGKAYYSNDGGISWSAATLPSGSEGRVELAYAKANSSIVYASVQAEPSQIWRSTDGGMTYSQSLSHTTAGADANCLGKQGWYNNAIWAGDPTNANFIIVGGINLWKSTDAGDTLSEISAWQYSPQSAHADHHAIVSDPRFNGTTNKQVYFGNDGGIYKAEDVSTVGNDPYHVSGWVNLNNGYMVTQFYGVAANANSKVILGGAQDNGTLRYTPAAGVNNWDSVFGGDGGYVASDPANDQNWYGEYVYLQIFRNLNGGAPNSEEICGQWYNFATGSWVWKAAPYLISDAKNEAALFIAPFILDPNNASCLLGGAASLWRTNDPTTPNTNITGPSWAAIKSAIPGAYISAIAVAKGNSNLILVGYNSGQIFQTINGTNNNPNWTEIGRSIGARRACACITIDPVNNLILYATFGGYQQGNVWKSTNGGTTWSNIGQSLPPAPVRWLTIHPQNSSYLYLATEVGVFASENAGTTWSPTNEGPTNCVVFQLVWLGNTLICATHGRGMFQIDLTIWKSPKTILVGDNGGNLYAVDALTGSQTSLQSYANAPILAAPLVVNQTAYLGAGSTLYALAASNQLVPKWQAPVSGSISATPQVDNNIVYVSTATGYLYAFDASTGAPLWNVNVLNLPAGGVDTISTNLVMNNWVYLVAKKGIYTVNLATRQPGWNSPINCGGLPLLAADTVFVPSTDGNLYAMNPRSGATLWKRPVGGVLHSTPTWIMGAVFVANNTGTLVGYNYKTGQLVATQSLPNMDVNALIADGTTLYIVGNAINGYVAAYTVIPGLPTWTLTQQWTQPFILGAARAPIVVGDNLYINAINKKTFSLSAVDGSVQWSFATQGALLAAPSAIYPVGP